MKPVLIIWSYWECGKELIEEMFLFFYLKSNNSLWRHALNNQKQIKERGKWNNKEVIKQSTFEWWTLIDLINVFTTISNHFSFVLLILRYHPPNRLFVVLSDFNDCIETMTGLQKSKTKFIFDKNAFITNSVDWFTYRDVNLVYYQFI